MSLSQALNQFAQNLGRYPGFIYLILCTVSGVAAGLQNTG